MNLTLNETLKSKARLAFKKEERKLGFICFLHTYGRDMKRHPHIHVLFAEKFMRNNGTLGNFYYLGFEAIRKRYLFTILNLLQHELKKKNSKTYNSFLKEKSIVLNRCKEGSYFYGKPVYAEGYSMESAKATAKYIARYASHLALSERRILKRDKENKTVTWFYDPHEDDLCEEKIKLVDK